MLKEYYDNNIINNMKQSFILLEEINTGDDNEINYKIIFINNYFENTFNIKKNEIINNIFKPNNSSQYSIINKIIDEITNNNLENNIIIDYLNNWYILKGFQPDINFKAIIICDIKEYDETKHNLKVQNDKLKILNEIISTANKTNDYDKFLELCLSSTAKLLDFECSAIHFYDKETNEITLQKSYNYSDELINLVSKLDISNSPFKIVYENANPYL